jgi:mono/diheme cytochrome c family protein
MTVRHFLHTMKQPALIFAVCAGLPFGLGCRGNPSEDPPVHWQRQMFTQDKGKAQRENTFFNDGRSMRPLVEGTIPTHAPLEPGVYETGKDESGNYAAKWPSEVSVNADLMARGQDRYNIYCSPCHDKTGSGNGIVVQRANKVGRWQPTSYFDERIMTMPVGQLFETITNGVRTMPGYAYQVPVSDRWAIVAYVRALQKSQRATLADVPESQRTGLK